MQPRRSLALGALLGLACLAGCKSAAELEKQADDEVRTLVESRRARLAIGDGSFTIAPDPASLRQRILRGEVQHTEPLDLVACLEIAAENSRDYQRRKEDLYLSALDLTLERWRFGLQSVLEADAHLDGKGDEATSADAGTRYSLTKMLGNGAKLAGDIGLNLARSLTFGDGWHAVSDFGGSITQPLLRRSSRAIVEEPLTQAERNLVYGVRTFERFRRTFAVDVATRFYAIMQQADVVVNQERNYQSLVGLRERNMELAKAGRVSDIDVGQARQDELSSKDSLLRARERYENQLDDFKFFLGLPIETELVFQPGALQGLNDPGASTLTMDEEHAVSFALDHRLDHLNVVDERTDSERKVRVAADALRAGLELKAEARATSQDGKPFDFNFQDTTWKLTSLLDLPVDQLPERNLYRESLIAHDVAVRTADQDSDQIRSDLRGDLRDLESRASSYEIQKNSVALAERRVESATLKLDAGRSDTRSVLEAQRSLLDAQNALTSALVEYTLARLNLFRDLELLRVDEQGIQTDEESLAGDEP